MYVGVFVDPRETFDDKNLFTRKCLLYPKPQTLRSITCLHMHLASEHFVWTVLDDASSQASIGMVRLLQDVGVSRDGLTSPRLRIRIPQRRPVQGSLFSMGTHEEGIDSLLDDNCVQRAAAFACGEPTRHFIRGPSIS